MAFDFENGSYTDAAGRTALDPAVYKDWQIGAAAEQALPPVDWFRRKLGLLPEELLPYGKTPKLDFLRIMERLKDRPDGKYIEVTAITPTPLGGEVYYVFGPDRRTGTSGRQRGRLSAPAFRRPHHERKGNCRRRRQRPAHSHDGVLPGPDRRYQRHHERPQSGYDRPECPYAA